MNRREMINFIKMEICPKLDLSQELDIDCIIKAIEKFRVSNHVKVKAPMTAEVNDNGHLFINGIHAGQITNKIPRPNFDESGYYAESKIIAMSESDYF